MALSKVLLPEPFGPMTEITCPAAARSEMSLITGSAP